MKSLIILFLFSGIVLPGCYYDVEEELYPPTTSCDTSSVTYTSTVVTLLQSNGCLGCHSGPAPSGNISLEGYNTLRAVAQTGKL